LVVSVGVRISTGTPTTTGVTYGGTSLTLVARIAGHSSNQSEASLWYLLNPPEGTADIVASFDENTYATLVATAFSGVNQTNPIGTAASAGDSQTNLATVNVSSATGELVIDSVMKHITIETLSVGAGQSEQAQVSANQLRGAQSTEAGATTVTMSWSWTGSARYWAIVAVPLKPASIYTQSAYRFFNNNTANSTDVGSALATQDNAATLTSDGQDFRLRLLIHVSDAQLAASGQNFKLQIAARSGTCDTGFSGESYSDLSPLSGDIRYYDDTDTAKTDGANLTANVNDPVHAPAHNTVEQDYEEANNFTNTVAAVPSGEDGEWDFSIVDFSAADNTTYCLRVLRLDGTLLDTYTVIPEFTTVPENSILLFGLYPLFLKALKKFRKKAN